MCEEQRYKNESVWSEVAPETQENQRTTFFFNSTVSGITGGEGGLVCQRKCEKLFSRKYICSSVHTCKQTNMSCSMSVCIQIQVLFTLDADVDIDNYYN